MMRTHVGLLTIVSSLLLPVLARAEQVQWRSDYDAARREAQQKGLPLLLDFGTENCFWCKKQDETTFRHPGVVRLLNEQFVPLKIDAEREPLLTQRVRVQAFPTLVLAAPDGKILETLEGYQDAARLQEKMQRAMALVSNPDWMVRDYEAAAKAAEKADYPRALSLLRPLLEDRTGRPVQAKARALFEQIEQQAAGRLATARQMHERGQTREAIATLTSLTREFAGTRPARDAGELAADLERNPELRAEQRARRARELLAQALEDRKARQYLLCLDRLEYLIAHYGDQPEGSQAVQLAAEIKDNAEWLQSVCESLSERLSSLYLAQADTWVRKGQQQQAVACLERVVQCFPGSRQAEIARTRLAQLRGAQTARPGDGLKGD